MNGAYIEYADRYIQQNKEALRATVQKHRDAFEKVSERKRVSKVPKLDSDSSFDAGLQRWHRGVVREGVQAAYDSEVDRDVHDSKPARDRKGGRRRANRRGLARARAGGGRHGKHKLG